MRGQSDGSHDLTDVALYVCICVCVELADDVQGQFDGSHDLTDACQGPAAHSTHGSAHG